MIRFILLLLLLELNGCCTAPVAAAAAAVTSFPVVMPGTVTRRHPYSPVSAAMAAAALALTTACKSYIVAEGLWRLLAASVAIFTTAIHGKNARSRGKIAKK